MQKAAVRKIYKFNIEDSTGFKRKLLSYFKKYDYSAFYDSNGFTNESYGELLYGDYDLIAGCGKINEISVSGKGSLNKFKLFAENNKEWLFGYLSYDIKNDIEKLYSKNIDNLEFPELFFFVPEIVFKLKSNTLTIEYFDNKGDDIEGIFQEIIETQQGSYYKNYSNIKHRNSKEEYQEKISKVKDHIQKGDIYEMNYCIEFYDDNANICPFNTFNILKENSKTPFSAFMRIKDKYILSASPERFIKKSGNKIISQPIKGTIKRGKNQEEDFLLKTKLRNDPKERAENVMIVDLVRNDLSRTAKKTTVKVEELFGVYPFDHVFQMISTISSELKEDVSINDIIKTTFPPGSMTGAPKIRAMELIEKYEKTKRLVYSGSIGYITPEKDFDFNVVIRTILYNKEKKYLSYITGGAITDQSIPENEYEECLLKAKAMLEVLT